MTTHAQQLTTEFQNVKIGPSLEQQRFSFPACHATFTVMEGLDDGTIQVILYLTAKAGKPDCGNITILLKQANVEVARGKTDRVGGLHFNNLREGEYTIAFD